MRLLGSLVSLAVDPFFRPNEEEIVEARGVAESSGVPYFQGANRKSMRVAERSESRTKNEAGCVG